MPVFINREKEIQFLNDWFHTEPNAILFIYGPKSCGKSSLLRKVVENHLDYKNFAVNYLDLRGMLIANFQSFINRFFPKYLRGKAKDVLGGVSMNTGFFGLNIDEEKALQEDPFQVMESKICKAKKRGVQPVIILDEIQMLKNIYINSERFLLDELFNLFVRLTKVVHLAHIVLLTSDSYFIEEIYNNAKLKKTVRFFFVDHLEKQEVQGCLKLENLGEDVLATIWKYLGGSPWEITECMEMIKKGTSPEQACRHFVEDEYGKLFEFYYKNLDEPERRTADGVHNAIITEGFLKLSQPDALVYSVIGKMVEHDFWFYRADKGTVTPNSKSIWWAIKKLGDAKV